MEIIFDFCSSDGLNLSRFKISFSRRSRIIWRLVRKVGNADGHSCRVTIRRFYGFQYFVPFKWLKFSNSAFHKIWKPALLSGSSPKDFLFRLFLIGCSWFSFKSIRLVVDVRIFRIFSIFFVRSVSNWTTSGFLETNAERFREERNFPLVRSERPHCRRRDFFDDGVVCEND